MKNFFKSIFGESQPIETSKDHSMCNKDNNPVLENNTNLDTIEDINAGLGIEFGISREELNSILESKGGIRSETNIDNGVFYDNLEFVGKKTEAALFLFTNNKLCKSAYYLKPTLEAHVFNLYNELKERIENKYRKAHNAFEYYEEPYFKDDGYTLQGIENGLITFSSYWFFGNTENKDSISLLINNLLEVEIVFEHGDLMKELVEHLDRKYENDF